MTNTLHRYGDAGSFSDDYIIFAIPSIGKNDEECIPKMQQFLRICAKYNPVNLGNGTLSGFAPEKGLNPTAHWKRKVAPDWKKVIEGIKKPGTVAAVFVTEESAMACLQEVLDADFGLSVNISTSVENAKQVGERCGIKRHSVEYALGFNDPHDHLPILRYLAFLPCVVMGWFHLTWQGKCSIWFEKADALLTRQLLL